MRNILTYLMLALILALAFSPTTAALCLIVLATAHGLLAASVMCVTRELGGRISCVETLYPVVVTADKAKDVGVDIIAFESAVFLVNVGAIAAAGLVMPVAQECDTLAGSYTDVAAADLDGAFVNCVANTPQKIGYKGTKRFLAIRADYVSGTSVLLGGTIISGDAHVREVA